MVTGYCQECQVTVQLLDDTAAYVPRFTTAKTITRLFGLVFINTRHKCTVLVENTEIEILDL